MITTEYGQNNPNVAILLHGGGLSWWSCKSAAELLAAKGFRTVLPVLDGHAGSDRDFTSIEANAAEIIAYIDTHFGGHVKLIAGLSLGGQVLLEMLAQRDDICGCAVIESALVLPMRVTNALLAPCIGMSYPLIAKLWFARLQFESLHLPPALFEDYYRDTRTLRKENMLAFLKANSTYTLKDTFQNCSAKVLVLVGKREALNIQRSAEKIHTALPSSRLLRLDGLRHGEASICHAEEYICAVLDFMNE